MTLTSRASGALELVGKGQRGQHVVPGRAVWTVILHCHLLSRTGLYYLHWSGLRPNDRHIFVVSSAPVAQRQGLYDPGYARKAGAGSPATVGAFASAAPSTSMASTAKPRHRR